MNICICPTCRNAVDMGTVCMRHGAYLVYSIYVLNKDIFIVLFSGAKCPGT
jgi:hypothetical protein